MPTSHVTLMIHSHVIKNYVVLFKNTPGGCQIKYELATINVTRKLKKQNTRN